MISANGSYGCAFVQNLFPPTPQSVYAWQNCSGHSPSLCMTPQSELNYTGLPLNATSGVGLGINSSGGGMVIGMLLLGVMAQIALNT